MRIVALVPGGIGDQVLFFPTLDELKKTYSNAEVAVVVEPRSVGAYRVCKSVDETISFDFQANNSPADWANLLGVLRDRTYDIALVSGQSWGLGFLLWLTGIPVRIGYSNSGTGFLTNPVPLSKSQYIACTYHDLTKGLGLNKPCPDLSISIPKRDLEWAEQEQKRLGISGGGYVLIHPGSGERSPLNGPAQREQRYPTESWSTIIQDFQQRQPDLPVVLVQGSGDADLVAALTKAHPRLKLTSPDNVGKLAAIIAGANLLLCNDSAPMHLAVALKVYTLALFGSNEPIERLPAPNSTSEETRFLAIQSSTGKVADIAPKTVLSKVWGE